MKKFTLFLLVFFISTITFYSKNYVGLADSYNYYRVISEKAYLYENASMQTILFTLPYTYYVNVTGEKGNLYQIEIYGSEQMPAFFGYTEKENLLKDGLEVASPYPTEKITTCTSTILYSDIDCIEKQNYIFAERKLDYFGTMQNSNGLTVYLVCYGERIGYVKINDIYQFTLPNHSNPLTFLEKEEDNTQTISDEVETKQDDDLILKISIICCLIIAGTIGLYVVLRKKEKTTKTTNYYDENEYE